MQGAILSACLRRRQPRHCKAQIKVPFCAGLFVRGLAATTTPAALAALEPINTAWH